MCSWLSMWVHPCILHRIVLVGSRWRLWTKMPRWRSFRQCFSSEASEMGVPRDSQTSGHGTVTWGRRCSVGSVEVGRRGIHGTRKDASDYHGSVQPNHISWRLGHRTAMRSAHAALHDCGRGWRPRRRPWQHRPWQNCPCRPCRRRRPPCRRHALDRPGRGGTRPVAKGRPQAPQARQPRPPSSH